MKFPKRTPDPNLCDYCGYRFPQHSPKCQVEAAKSVGCASVSGVERPTDPQDHTSSSSSSSLSPVTAETLNEEQRMKNDQGSGGSTEVPSTGHGGVVEHSSSYDRQKALWACREIAADMARDATAFDGQPFNGRTVAEYFGNQGAAIAALAGIVAHLLHDEADQ